jgi:hypothetical protein
MPDNEEMITGITGTAASEAIPQFQTAEYSHIPGTERCRICGGPISGEYFRVNSQMACGKCAAEARDGQPTDSHAAFARGLLLGAGAAVLGLILYSTFTIVTGWTVGYLALAVGWLVARGMMKGSNGVGGRRYQITAVLLTYAAISMSSIPVMVSYAIKHHEHRSAMTQQQSAPIATDQSATNDSTSVQVNGEQPPHVDTPAADSPQPQKRMGFGAALAQLALFGLASPFLELASPGSGILGLVILFVGLSIAFRMTAAKPLDVDGPFSTAG